MTRPTRNPRRLYRSTLIAMTNPLTRKNAATPKAPSSTGTRSSTRANTGAPDVPSYSGSWRAIPAAAPCSSQNVTQKW